MDVRTTNCRSRLVYRMRGADRKAVRHGVQGTKKNEVRCSSGIWPELAERTIRLDCVRSTACPYVDARAVTNNCFLPAALAYILSRAPARRASEPFQTPAARVCLIGPLHR